MKQELKTAVTHNFKDAIAKAIELTKDGHEIDVLHCQKVSNVYYVLKYKKKKKQQEQQEQEVETEVKQEKKKKKKKSTTKKDK